VILLHLLCDCTSVALLFRLERIIGGMTWSIVVTQSDVALALDLLHLPVLNVWLETEHPRYADARDSNEDKLEWTLAGEKLRGGVDRTWLQEHVDEHRKERRGLSRRFAPVDRPLVEDADDEVAKDGLQENHLGDEVCVDIDWALETDVVRELKAESKSHLRGR
jgi:hypothetical protein